MSELGGLSMSNGSCSKDSVAAETTTEASASSDKAKVKVKMAPVAASPSMHHYDESRTNQVLHVSLAESHCLIAFVYDLVLCRITLHLLQTRSCLDFTTVTRKTLPRRRQLTTPSPPSWSRVHMVRGRGQKSLW